MIRKKSLTVIFLLDLIFLFFYSYYLQDHRPRHRDFQHGYLYEYNIHGIVFVSISDLAIVLLAISVMVVCGVISVLSARAKK